MDHDTTYQLIGDGFSVTIQGTNIPTGSIVQAVIEATLAVGESINIERVK